MLSVSKNSRTCETNHSPFATGSGQPRLRMDQVKAEGGEEQLLAETRQRPLRLARRLGDLASLLL